MNATVPTGDHQGSLQYIQKNKLLYELFVDG